MREPLTQQPLPRDIFKRTFSKQWMIVTGGLRIREIARRLGIHPGAVHSWKRRDPALSRTCRIAEARGLTLSELLYIVERVWG